MLVPKQEVIDRLREIIKDIERDGDDYINTDVEVSVMTPIYARIRFKCLSYDLLLK